MNLHKSLLTYLAQAFHQYRCDREQERIDGYSDPVTRKINRWPELLPNPGTVIFTLLAITGLLWAQSAGAVPFAATNAASTGTIAYQGRLADTAGAPLTGTYNMTFRLYSAASGGAPLWEEGWTGANSVQVSDGLFNVMLGSLAQIPANIVTTNSSLFLGITVGTDSEMAPRVQLGSVPFAVQALTVPDGSVTTAKLADGSVTQEKLASDMAVLPFVPRVLKYISKQNDILLNSSPTGVAQAIETINFTLAAPPTGYRWDLEWRFNQRFGAMYQQSVGASFLLDGAAVKDSSGVPFVENLSLSIQGSPTDNMVMGGMVYQNNVASGSHTLTWQISAWGEPSNQFLMRQRWLVLTAILVPESF